MANATVVLYLVHEDYAIDRTVVLHSTVPVVVEHVVVLHIVAPSCCTSTSIRTIHTVVLPYAYCDSNVIILSPTLEPIVISRVEAQLRGP